MGATKKRVAVLISKRQAEGLRMAVGLTVLGDSVDVYVLDVPVEKGPQMDMSIEALNQMGGSVFTNIGQNPFELVSTEDIAKSLTQYDVVIPY